MIFLHLIIGIILGKLTNNYLPFILGSIIPDIDHIYTILKHKLYNKKFLDTLKNEEKYKIRYKTPLVHSILGLIIFTILFYLVTNNYLSAIYFSLAYLLHLLIDWPDKDIKHYLYPSKIKFSGFLPIWSKQERIITIVCIFILLIVLIY
jgi:membrane-bound metal-dependent hydrolase YbcI (DUF457 family)